MSILIIGAGGHGQVVADALLRSWESGIGSAPIGFLDDDPALLGASLLGLPVLGTVSEAATAEHELIVAVGDNARRTQLFDELTQAGCRIAVAVHPKAIVAPDVVVRPGTMICAGAIVNCQTVIGSNVILNTGCTVDHHSEIADHCHVAPGVHLGGGVRVGRQSLIGIGATVMPGRRIGSASVVGAGAVVIADVPDKTTVVGVPARVSRYHQADSEKH